MNRTILMALSAACLLSACGSTSHEEGVIVHTKQGAVQGRTIDGVTSFKGIPYAAAPVGDLRWQAPQQPPIRAAVLEAYEFGAACPQSTAAETMSGGPVLSDLDDLAGVFPVQDTIAEDCLFLNVFKPQNAKAADALPVVVYVHGGAFVQGSGNADFAALVQRGVIAVSINYRLGVLGYLADAELLKQDQHNALGNFGLRDQIAALAWVKSNIAAFGGNPQQVTYWGTSAGATSGFSLLQSPLTEGLFQGIFLQSGGGGAYSNPSAEQSLQVGTEFVNQVACNASTERTACLRSKSLADILEAQTSLRWRPTVDGVALTDVPAKAFEDGRFNRVPVLIGGVRDEGTLFSTPTLSAADYEAAVARLLAPSGASPSMALKDYPVSHYPSAGMAVAQIQGDALYACGNAARSDALAKWGPVYSYEFTDPAKSFPVPLPPYYLGSFHGFDSLYWFGTRNAGNTDANRLELQNAMLAYAVNFIRTGNPNGVFDALVRWPRYASSTPSVLALAVPQITIEHDFKSLHRCDSTWSAEQLPLGFY